MFLFLLSPPYSLFITSSSRDTYITKTNHSSSPFLLSNPSETPNYTKSMAYRVFCDLTPLQSLLLTQPALSSMRQPYWPLWLSSPSSSLPSGLCTQRQSPGSNTLSPAHSSHLWGSTQMHPP